MSINLLHPFTRLQKKLPNATTLFREQGLYVNVTSASYDAFIDKFVLTASPSHTSDYVVLVMYYVKLAFCRPGDESCTRIIYPSGVVDAVYHKNRFYCLGMNGIFVCDIEGPNPNPSLANHVATFSEEQNPRGKYHCGVGHVVESSGTLLLVAQQGVQKGPDNNYGTTGFKVYEVGLDGGEWKELKSLAVIEPSSWDIILQYLLRYRISQDARLIAFTLPNVIVTHILVSLVEEARIWASTTC